MATKDDRSLSAGISFPKWMKNKMNDKFDLDQNTFSPTELDDSFMYYFRHPAKNDSAPPMTDTKIVKASNDAAVKVDFSNVTAAADQFTKPRAKGIDDGFKSGGSSILRVANQIVSGKSIPENVQEPVDECEQLLAKFDPYRRRGSRSLPASPSTSPKCTRRNKYFTNPYVEADKSKGWILSSLLAKREISQSMDFIGEEKREELDRAAAAMSVEDLTAKQQQQLKSQLFKAKASELREMNFWSPTSM